MRQSAIVVPCLGSGAMLSIRCILHHVRNLSLRDPTGGVIDEQMLAVVLVPNRVAPCSHKCSVYTYSIYAHTEWSGRRGSNSRPLPWQGNGLGEGSADSAAGSATGAILRSASATRTAASIAAPTSAPSSGCL